MDKKPLPTRHIALISVHGCPLARLGTRDTGGMSVYVHQLARGLGRRGFIEDNYTRHHDPCEPLSVALDENVRVINLKAGPAG